MEMINRSKESFIRITNAMPDYIERKYIREKCYELCNEEERIKALELTCVIHEDETIFRWFAECEEKGRLLQRVDYYVMKFLSGGPENSYDTSDLEIIAETIAHSILSPDVIY